MWPTAYDGTAYWGTAYFGQDAAVSYTAPTIAPSGTTFAQLRAGGPTAILERIISARPTAKIPTLRTLERGNLEDSWQWFQVGVTNFATGEPVPLTDLIAQVHNFHVLAASLAQIANEVGTLIAANPGTIANVQTAIGATTPRRIWP